MTSNTYQWTCPICGKSRAGIARNGRSRSDAVNALRTHIASTHGDGHGDVHELPDELEVAAYDDHVTVDEDRDREPSVEQA